MSDMPFFSYKILIPPFSERIFKWSIQIRIFTFQDRKFYFILLKGKYEIIAIVNTTGIDKAIVTSHNK